MIVIIGLVIIGGLVGIHWYLWRRLVRDVSAPGGWYRRIGTVLVVVMPVLAVLSQAGRRMNMPFEVERVIAWPGGYWFALLLYLVLALLVGELVRPLALWVIRRSRATPDQGGDEAGSGSPAAAPTASAPMDSAPMDSAPTAAAEAAPGARAEEEAGGESAVEPGGTVDAGRRLFLARSVAVGAGLIAGGTVTYGSYAARNLTTKRVTVPLAKLPAAARGYRIAVVSDIHLSAMLGPAHCRRVVETVNRGRPDLITVVGDLVDGSVADLRPAAAPLAELSAPDGSFFVTGNHEYFGDAHEWIDHVRELGLMPLENDRVELPFFDLAGVNDLQGEESDHGPDFEAALGDRDPQRTSVLMAHQPVQIHDAVDYGVDLQLSGHTHGGQMWPVNYLAGLANPTLAGLERYGDTQLYVTRGAGSWGPPVRVGAEPDVTLIELVPLDD